MQDDPTKKATSVTGDRDAAGKSTDRAEKTVTKKTVSKKKAAKKKAVKKKAVKKKAVKKKAVSKKPLNKQTAKEKIADKASSTQTPYNQAEERQGQRTEPRQHNQGETTSRDASAPWDAASNQPSQDAMSDRTTPPQSGQDTRPGGVKPQWIERLEAQGTPWLNADQLDAVLAWLSGREQAKASDQCLQALLQHLGPASANSALTQSFFQRLDKLLFVRGALDLESAHVAPSIDHDERRTRYRRLMNAFHPDRFQGEQAAFLTERSQAIVAAYQRFKKGEDDSPPALAPYPSATGKAAVSDITSHPYGAGRSAAQLSPLGGDQARQWLDQMRGRLSQIDHLHIKAPVALALVLLMPLVLLALFSEPPRPEPVAFSDAAPPVAGMARGTDGWQPPPSADQITQSQALLEEQAAQARRRIAQIRAESQQAALSEPADFSATRFDPNPQAIPRALLENRQASVSAGQESQASATAITSPNQAPSLVATDTPDTGLGEVVGLGQKNVENNGKDGSEDNDLNELVSDEPARIVARDDNEENPDARAMVSVMVSDPSPAKPPAEQTSDRPSTDERALPTVASVDEEVIEEVDEEGVEDRLVDSRPANTNAMIVATAPESSQALNTVRIDPASTTPDRPLAAETPSPTPAPTQERSEAVVETTDAIEPAAAALTQRQVAERDAPSAVEPAVAIRQLLRQWAAAFSLGDVSRFMAPVAQSVRENELADREAMQTYYAALFAATERRSMSINVVRVLERNGGFDVVGLLNRSAAYPSGKVERVESMARYRIEADTPIGSGPMRWRIVSIDY